MHLRLNFCPLEIQHFKKSGLVTLKLKLKWRLSGIYIYLFTCWTSRNCYFFRSAHDSLLDRINQLCSLHKSSPAGTSAKVSLLPPSEPMPKFYNRKDFPAVSVWTAAEWAVHPLNKKKVTQDVSLFPKSAIQIDPNSCTSMFYLQDAQGLPVTESRAAMICSTARGLFQHLRSQSMAPKSWSKCSDPAAQYFYCEMVKFELNFLMAEDHWKLECFAIDTYFNWYRQQKDGNDVKQEVKIEEGSNLNLKKCKESLSPWYPLRAAKSQKYWSRRPNQLNQAHLHLHQPSVVYLLFHSFSFSNWFIFSASSEPQAVPLPVVVVTSGEAVEGYQAATKSSESSMSSFTSAFSGIFIISLIFLLKLIYLFSLTQNCATGSRH
jgi:hypothetical protein